MASTNINIRVDGELKTQAQELFSNLGLDMSTAINIFLKRSVSYGGIPFEIREERPAQAVLDSMREAEDILNGKVPAKRYSSAREMIDDILSEEDE